VSGDPYIFGKPTLLWLSSKPAENLSLLLFLVCPLLLFLTKNKLVRILLVLISLIMPVLQIMAASDWDQQTPDADQWQSLSSGFLGLGAMVLMLVLPIYIGIIFLIKNIIVWVRN
jgi:xanthine/uracil permease